VTVLSRDPAAFQRQFPAIADVPSLGFVRGDVTSISTAELHADYLIHGAADSSAVVDEAVRSRVIVEGTRRMTGLARTNGARICS
jgi:nucleoside-diphosphate-sugar epimerase